MVFMVIGLQGHEYIIEIHRPVLNDWTLAKRM
jgi:hypothetical protein